MSISGLFKNPKKITLVLRLLVVAVSLFLAARHFSWIEIKEAFSRLSFAFFGLALFLFLTGQVIIGFRWWLLLRIQDIRISPWYAVKLHYLGLFYNNVMPSTMGGDFIRAGYATMHTEKKVAAFLSVFVDRLIGLLSTSSIVLVCYFIFMKGQTYPQGPESEKHSPWPGIFAEVLILLFLCVLIMAAFPAGRRMLKKVFLLTLMKIKMVIIEFIQSVKLYCRKPHFVMAAILATVGLQLMIITGFSILGSEMGISVPIGRYFFFFAVSWVVGALPISIGGLGIAEGSIIFLFYNIGGAEKGAAFALALCQRLIWLLASLPGAIIHAMGSHLPADFSIDDEKAIS